MKRWGLFRRCGECNEPVEVVDVCKELGYNPGVDGHFFRSEREAYLALGKLMDRSNHYTNFWDDVDVLEIYFSDEKG